MADYQKRPRGRVDPGLLVCLGLAVIAAWPFLARPGVPVMTDAEMHVYRAAEILDALRAGVPYTRWAPDFYYAYGYPVFNYYSPLTYYLAAGYALLTGAGAVAGIKFVFVLGYLLAAAGMYLFVRDRWGGVAGVVAAAAFVFSPYLLFIDSHARGDAPEFFAIAAAPLMFWAVSRLRRSRSPGDAALLAFAIALVVMSHPLMALVFFSLLLLWTAWELVFGSALLFRDTEVEVPDGRPWLWLLLAISLGLGLSALLWVPAALERGAIQLHKVAGPGFFDFHTNFISLVEILSPSRAFDLGATQVRFHFNLGVVQWMLATAGALTVFPRRTRRFSVLFFALMGLLTVYLILPSSAQFWEAIPPMAFFQFPARFLGPAALLVAVLAGAATTWVALLRWRRAAPVAGLAALLAILATALPLTSPPPWGEFGPVNPRRMLQVELDGRARGTTSADDFLPAGVEVVPGPQASLIASYQGSGPVDKVNRATLPAGAQVEVLYHGPLEDRFRVLSPEDFAFRLFTFNFPGWTAAVDGKQTPIETAKPDGFITFPVPAGRHEVRVWLGNTPARWLGQAMSLLSGLSVLGLLGMRLWFRQEVSSPVSPPLERNQALAFGLLLLAFGGMRLVAERAGWLTLHSSGQTVLVAGRQQYAELGGKIALLAYDLPRGRVHAGDRYGVPLTLYWKRTGPVAENYQVFVHLVGPDGALWGQSDELNPAGFPTSRWPDDQYVRDEHVALLRPDAPPGVYRLQVGLWLQTSGERLPVRTAGGELIGDVVQLVDTIEVLP